MKHSIPPVFALLLSTALLGACSQDDTITIENPPAELTETEEADVESSEETVVAEEDSEDTEDDSGSNIDGVDQKNVKLEVSNQKTAGQIKVSKVATARDGWVSVHESREDGTILLPDSIGEARVDSGDSENIIVDLWDAPAVGDKLWVLLHVDSGERGLYEFPEQDPPVKRNGETMVRSLIIQGDEKKEDEVE